ncbi:hypothetical protein GEV33_007693 [Tenebrio molitor]|uniref:Uncharacterized protein n=1 Tax=Tenebrio molitor TaxID=7067 RepID=A0A8J6HIQ5_TENMO|nr:hypothetical protein GEV33_007693 [Tenebrio molitor]
MGATFNNFCKIGRPAGLSFPGLYFSLNQHSIETQFSQHPRLPQLPPQFSSRTTSWRHPSVKPNQGGSEPRLRRSSVGGYHTHSDELLLSTFGPTEPRDVIQARTWSDQFSQYRTLRGAETGQAAPVISGPNKCCAVF